MNGLKNYWNMKRFAPYFFVFCTQDSAKIPRKTLIKIIASRARVPYFVSAKKAHVLFFKGSVFNRGLIDAHAAIMCNILNLIPLSLRPQIFPPPSFNPNHEVRKKAGVQTTTAEDRAWALVDRRRGCSKAPAFVFSFCLNARRTSLYALLFFSIAWHLAINTSFSILWLLWYTNKHLKQSGYTIASADKS